jgi:hypothetical protein
MKRVDEDPACFIHRSRSGLPGANCSLWYSDPSDGHAWSGYEPYPKRPPPLTLSDPVSDIYFDLDFHALNPTEKIPSDSPDPAKVGIL